MARAVRVLPPELRVTPDTPSCEIHEVKKGESLWLISARRLGDPYLWPKVYGENRDHIFDPNVIEIDDRIRVPGACNPPGVR
jgi:nucleoid-associated protein YgaU